MDEPPDEPMEIMEIWISLMSDGTHLEDVFGQGGGSKNYLKVLYYLYSLFTIVLGRQKSDRCS